MKHLAYLTLAALFSLTSAFAEEQDAAGCKDHPLLTRMPGFRIEVCTNKQFEATKMPVPDPKKSDNLIMENIEGPQTFLQYKVKQGLTRPSRLQVIRNYQNALKKIGGVLIGEYPKWQDWSAGGQYHDHTTVLKLTKDGKEIWVGVEAVYDDVYRIVIAEREAMTQDVVANDLLDKINKDGFIALYINFDTGKATIKPDSFGQLDQVVAALKQASDLKLEVGGHTDNVGTPASNQTLSDARAKSVMAYLTGKGITANRLTAKGYGQTAPIADNRSEDGRAKNRRVELSKR